MKLQIKYLIADDESLARDSIKILLADDPELHLVGECKSGQEVLDSIQKHTIDLLWLDIQMPKWNGFEILEKLAPEKIPYIIFVTAYDEFALKAFEYKTIDYLLKPFSNERFYKALEKAKDVISRKETPPIPLQDIFRFYTEQQRYRKRLSVKVKDKIILLEVRNIDWIKATEGYLEISVHQKKYLIQDSLKNLELQLNPSDFVRIHRSTIINLERIHALEPWFNGEYHVILKNEERFKLSRNYRDKLTLILDNR